MNEFPKVFSKNRFYCVLFIIGVPVFFCLLGVFCWITGLDIEWVVLTLFFIGAAFALGCSCGYKNCEKDQREAEKQRQIEEEYKRVHNSD